MSGRDDENLGDMSEDRLEEMAASLRALLEDIEGSPCLVVADPRNLPPQTKLIVTCSGDTVEFTIQDSNTCKALVKDGKNFPEATEGKLVGTQTSIRDTSDDVVRFKRTLRPGRLLRAGLLVYEVGGKEFSADGIHGVKIVYPSGKSFDLWSD
jgi:hypothetical protein